MEQGREVLGWSIQLEASIRVISPVAASSPPERMTGTMKRICSLTILALASGALPAHAATSCPADAVLSGPLCVDKYEASVWETSDKKTIEKIRSGEIKKAKDLAAATARGTESDDYDDGAGCPDTGSHCVALYAVSVPGVLPSRFLITSPIFIIYKDEAFT